jgi:hypothetical protein
VLTSRAIFQRMKNYTVSFVAISLTLHNNGWILCCLEIIYPSRNTNNLHW